MEARRQWGGMAYSKYWKAKTVNQEFYKNSVLAKLPYKNKREIKTSQDKN